MIEVLVEELLTLGYVWFAVRWGGRFDPPYFQGGGTRDHAR